MADDNILVCSFQISAEFPNLSVLEKCAEGDHATISKHPDVMQAYLRTAHA
jgi:ABC-type branched-subunit amino acid transport system ATPase component